MSAGEMPFGMAVESGLAAHFKQPDGPSVPGVSWLVRIEYGGRRHYARVKALFANDATKATRRDQAYQVKTTMDYLTAEIVGGWDPGDEREHTIRIGNPPGQQARPWWRLW